MIRGTMTVWFVVAVPVLIMFFALAMERLENRLHHLTVHENEVEEFLQAARPDEVRVLFGSGISGALELFRRRRRPSAGARVGSPRVGLPTVTAPNGAGLLDGASSPDSTGLSDLSAVTSRHTPQRS
jgi:hypothetical protein